VTPAEELTLAAGWLRGRTLQIRYGEVDADPLAQWLQNLAVYAELTGVPVDDAALTFAREVIRATGGQS
jgi:hypothetical protein